MRQPVLFCRQSNDEISGRQGGREQLINLYPELDGSDITYRTCLAVGTEVASFPGEVKAFQWHKGVLHAVAGGKLWNVLSGAELSTLTGVDSDATMASDGASLAITSGGAYQVWDGSSISSPTVGALPGGVSSVVFANGRMFLTGVDVGTFAVSGVNDAGTLNALDFATAEYSPDATVRAVRYFNEVVLFGTETVQFATPQGGAGVPFAVTSNTVQVGCRSPRSILRMDNSLIWAGTIVNDNGDSETAVYRMISYTEKRISSHAMDRIVTSYDPEALSASAYTDGGHQFYTLRMPDCPAWSRDLATGLWHERSSGVDLGAWAVTSTVYDTVNRRWLAGLSDGRVCVLKGRETDDGGEYLRQAQSRIMRFGGGRFTVNSFEVDAMTGRDETEGKMSLQLSGDGETWNSERWLSLGALGEYARQLLWSALGQWRKVAARLRVTDAVDVTIFEASLDVVRDD